MESQQRNGDGVWVENSIIDTYNRDTSTRILGTISHNIVVASGNIKSMIFS
jgi:hypothetical protein